jgi:PKD repeat protein
MGFDCGTNGTFTMNFEGLNTFDATSYITVEDRKTNIFHDVRSGNYTFTGDTLDNLNRFVIHFTPAAVITKTDATCNTAGTINVVQPGTANWSYTVTNSNSVAIGSGSLNTNSPIAVNVPTGVYTITLVDNNNYTVVKQVQVNGAQQVVSSFTTTSNIVEQDADVVFTSTSTYATNNAWNFGDNTTATGVTTIHSYTTPGTYNATLASDNNDCNAVSTQQITVTAKATTGIMFLIDNKSVAIWSSDNTVYVDMSKQPKVDATIEIYNVLGQQLSKEKFGRSSIYTKALTNLEAAYVIVRVKNNDEIITKKLFVGNGK